MAACHLLLFPGFYPPMPTSKFEAGRRQAGRPLGQPGLPNVLWDVPGTLQILPKSPPCLKKCPDRLPGGSGKVPGHPQGPPRTNFSSIFL